MTQRTSVDKPVILIATGNPGKVRELSGLLGGIEIEFKCLADFPNVAEVPETGSTFAENARLKAVGYAFQTGIVSLADDSGLVVDALGGAPGVLSARYGGEIGFDRKMEMLLAEMECAPDKIRSARFVCAMTIANENGEILAAAEGVCEGRIAEAPRGNGGFGYDPIFVPDGYNNTFGELNDAEKQQISHRARAAAKIMRYLLGFKPL
ncbi:MAG: RdgB/HAM1 family non-canonical purine NTP pyrophosphatase [Acidobacteria bacterium]|nr:RdgB/HAM1 family non-canonical purine NTP pyrophosphatase [Acidobacteriota bacterium]